MPKPLHTALAALAFLIGLAHTPDAHAEPQLPDYVQQLNAQSQRTHRDANLQPITADTNAFVALLPLFDREHDPWEADHFAALLRELNLAPEAMNGQTPLVWWDDWAKAALPIDDERHAVEAAILDGPWSPDEHPLAENWINEQAPAIAALRAALNRPLYHAPLVRIHPTDSAMDVLLPHLGRVRMMGRTLQAHALRDLHRGDTAAVLDTLQHLRKLADHVRHEPVLLSGLVAISVDSIAAHVGNQLLTTTPLNPDQAQRLAGLFPTCVNAPGLADTIDRGERVMALDFIDLNARRTAANHPPPLTDWVADDFGPLLELMTAERFDRDRAKQQFNAVYDLMADAFAEPDLADAFERYAPIEQRLENHEPAPWVNAAFWEGDDPATQQRAQALLENLPPREAFTDEVVAALAGMLLPALDAAVSTERRVDASRTLIRLAAFLDIHRAKHGQYPDRLDALVTIAKAPLPRDIDGQPFRYQPTDDRAGYTLHSVGQIADAPEPLSDSTREMLTLTVQR